MTLEEAYRLWPVASLCRCGVMAWGWGARAVVDTLEPCVDCPPPRRPRAKPHGVNLYADGPRCTEHARAWWVRHHLLCLYRR